MRVEAAPFVGERYRARRSVQQPHANTSLKPCHRAADAGLREAKRISGPDEVACLHDRGQDADAAKQPAIERHDDLLSMIPEIHPA